MGSSVGNVVGTESEGSVGRGSMATKWCDHNERTEDSNFARGRRERNASTRGEEENSLSTCLVSWRSFEMENSEDQDEGLTANDGGISSLVPFDQPLVAPVP